jgi:hypothetical protein
MIPAAFSFGLCGARLSRVPFSSMTALPISAQERKGRAHGERAHQLELAAESLRAIGGGAYA